MVLLLFVLIVGVIILWFTIKAIGSSTFSYCLSRNVCGISSPATTYFLGKIVKKMIKADGFKVSQIDIVHQFGNCYQGLAVISGDKVSLSITADKYGNIAYNS